VSLTHEEIQLLNRAADAVAGTVHLHVPLHTCDDPTEDCCVPQVDTTRLSQSVFDALAEVYQAGQDKARIVLEPQVVALVEVQDLAQRHLDDPTWTSGRKLQQAVDKAREVLP
jgi:hypothetical protein